MEYTAGLHSQLQTAQRLAKADSQWTGRGEDAGVGWRPSADYSRGVSFPSLQFDFGS